MADTLSGQCLCGAVKFTATPAGDKMGVCHCGMCRRWTGGAFMSTSCDDTVKFENEDAVGRYRGSSWGERVFCKSCGSTILWQTQDGKGQQVAIHTFENPDDFTFATEIFIDRKPDNYAFANETKTMTEAEVFALFAPSPEGKA